MSLICKEYGSAVNRFIGIGREGIGGSKYMCCYCGVESEYMDSIADWVVDKVEVKQNDKKGIS